MQFQQKLIFILKLGICREQITLYMCSYAEPFIPAPMNLGKGGKEIILVTQIPTISSVKWPSLNTRENWAKIKPHRKYSHKYWLDKWRVNLIATVLFNVLSLLEPWNTFPSADKGKKTKGRGTYQSRSPDKMYIGHIETLVEAKCNGQNQVCMDLMWLSKSTCEAMWFLQMTRHERHSQKYFYTSMLQQTFTDQSISLAMVMIPLIRNAKWKPAERISFSTKTFPSAVLIPWHVHLPLPYTMHWPTNI